MNEDMILRNENANARQGRSRSFAKQNLLSTEAPVALDNQDTRSRRSINSQRKASRVEENDEIFSDEDDEKKEIQLVKRQRQRYGHQIRGDKYKISNLFRIVAILLAIMIIPIQIFMKSMIQNMENNMIKDLQSKGSLLASDGFQVLYEVLIVAFSSEFSLLVSIFLFLSMDSLIAFKAALLCCLGIYVMVLLKLMYESPRPFWMERDIIAYRGHCKFDFGSPSQHVFSLVYFYPYLIFMYFQKYTLRVNKPLVASLYVLDACLASLTFLGLLVMGQVYLYQIMISILYSFVFLLLTITFDAEILNKCEQIGFIVRSSRKYKFYLLLFCMGMYLVGLVLLQGDQNSWAEQQVWIINISNNLEHCKEKMFETGATRIGMDVTFEQSSILFYLVGMGFGCSYSLVDVDCIDWVKTSLGKRILRALIGCGLACGIYLVFDMEFNIDNQHMTEYLVKTLVPYLLIPFFAYGPYLILCQKIGLVDQDAVYKNTMKQVDFDYLES